MKEQNISPPQHLNIVLIILVQVLALGSLYMGSHVFTQWWAMVICAIFYSFVLQTNYALMHEAMHGILHQNPRINRCLGIFCSALFPLPFSLVRVTHEMHHRHNRDANERFDVFDDNRFSWRKTLSWYGIMTGFFWLATVIVVNTIAIFPKILQKIGGNRHAPHVFRALRIYYAQNSALFPRLQLLLIGVYWGLAIWLLQLSPTMLLFGAIAFAFNWSTRQYIQHAYADLDKKSGSHNLRTHRLNRWLLLNGNWDLVHHEYPSAPWIALAQIGQSQPEQPRISYIKQYLRMWRGPILQSQLIHLPDNNESTTYNDINL